MSARPGRVRGARLTDLPALGELSRLSHPTDGEQGAVRSLGLPVSRSQFSVFSLFRMPLGAFRPSDQLYVYEEGSRLAGLARVERDSQRDEWTIVELDAIGFQEAGDIRLRLVQHLLRDGARRGAIRFHVACADADGNVELFMQAGFISYGQERLMYLPPEAELPMVGPDGAAAARIRPAVPLDALPLSRLYAAATPQPVVRLEAYRLSDWERQVGQGRVPRSSLAPVLRFADVEAFVQEDEGGGRDGTALSGFVQVGVAKEDQPHYLRVVVLPGCDADSLVSYGLSVIGERTGAHRGPGRFSHEHEHGVITPVRTYESPVDSRVEDRGFAAIATVTLLMKESAIRVAEPVLVPATR
jgi:hypothetical protein